MKLQTKPIRSPIVALPLALLLAGCVETRSTIIADPVDVTPYEGFWINARTGVAQVLAINAEDEGARSAKVTYVFIQRHRDGGQVSPSHLRAQATEIGNVLYFELTGLPDGGKPAAAERSIGRISFGTAEAPNDRDKLSVCFAEADALKGPVEKGALKGVIVAGRKDGLIPEADKVRITASTAELRAYLKANPLKCAPSSWFVFARAKSHDPTHPAGPR